MQRQLIALLFLFVFAFGLHAQSESIPSVIGRQNGEYAIFHPDGSQTPLGAGVVVHDTYGQAFLYTRTINFVSSLHYFDGQQGRVLSESIIGTCSAQFSEAGTAVIYLEQESMGENYFDINVMWQSLIEDSEPEQLGMVRFGIGGGGGGPFYINDEIYWEDVSQYPGVPPLLEVTDYGIFYNASCNYYGLYRSDSSSSEPRSIADFYVWAISPDKSQIIGYQWIAEGEGNLVLYDLARGTTEIIFTIPNLANRRSEMFFQLHWADANTLYYATSQFIDSDYGLALAEGDTGAIPPHTATIQISRFDLTTRSAEIIYEQANSWAVGRMASDANHLYFSVIPDGTAIAEAYQAGSLEINDSASAEALIQPDIYRIPLRGGDSELLYEDVSRFFLLSSPE